MPKTRITRYAIIVFLFLPLITFAETQEIKEYRVIKRDTLWDISKKELNDPFLWSKVWKKNPRIANPDKIYPGQMIKIPLYLIQKQKSEEEVTSKPASASEGPAIAANQRYNGIEKEVTSKPASASEEPAIVTDQRYKGIKGIVLYDGNVIEGQIISMNADTVKIRTKDKKVMSYSFERDVDNFIKE